MLEKMDKVYFFDPSEYGDIQETIETPIEDKKKPNRIKKKRAFS